MSNNNVNDLLERATAAMHFFGSFPTLVGDENIPDSDSDGLVQYYNLGAQKVINHPDYVKCLPYLNSFASLARLKYHKIAERKNLGPFDLNVWIDIINNLYNLGFSQTSNSIKEYSETQTSSQFNSQLLKTIMDLGKATALPDSVMKAISDFMNSIGRTIGDKWNNKQKEFSTSTVSTCHELVGDSFGVVYVPKLRYYNIQLTAEQQQITTACSSSQSIVYKFKYQYMVAVWNYQLIFSPQGSSLLKKVNETIANVNEKAASESKNFFDTDDMPESSPALVGELPPFPSYVRRSGRWIPTGLFWENSPVSSDSFFPELPQALEIVDQDDTGIVLFTNFAATGVSTHPDYAKVLPFLNKFASLTRKSYHAIGDRSKLPYYSASLWDSIYNQIASYGFGASTSTATELTSKEKPTQFSKQVLEILTGTSSVDEPRESLFQDFTQYLAFIRKVILENLEANSTTYSVIIISTNHDLVTTSKSSSVYVPKFKYIHAQLNLDKKRSVLSPCTSIKDVLYEIKYQYNSAIWNYPFVFSPEGSEQLKAINKLLANVDEKLVSESPNYFDGLTALLPILPPHSGKPTISLPSYSRKSARWIPTGDFIPTASH